jgi:hypothetical protein
MEKKLIVFKKDSSQSWDEDIIAFYVSYESRNKCMVFGVLREVSSLTAADKDVKFYQLSAIIEIIKDVINLEHHISSSKDYIKEAFSVYGVDVEFLDFELIEKYNG